MKNQNWKKWMITISVVVSIVTLGVVLLIKDFSRYDKDNLFAYAVDLENENWTYAPNGLDYGMTADEVIKADRLKDYVWEVESEILRVESSFSDLNGELKEFTFVKRYFFDSHGELASVRYELKTGYENYEVLQKLLYNQASSYMPETNRKTSNEDIINTGESSGRLVKDKMKDGKQSDDEAFLNIKVPITRVVWDDTVYISKEEDEISQYAHSELILGIDISYGGEVTVSLVVSRYKDRMNVADVQEIQEQYPIHTYEEELESVSDNPLIHLVLLYPVDWVALNNKTVVYVQIDEDMDVTTRKNVLTKEQEEHYLYPAIILADTEGILEVGETRYFDRKYKWNEEKPWYYSDGKIQMIFPVEDYYINHEEDRLNYSERSAFYVTMDGYVVPGFDENEYSEPFERCVISETSLLGLTVEDLLRKFKK